MTDLRASFRRPFAEQLAALRLRFRDLQGQAKWDGLWQSEHDRAFMVAGALKADLLSDLASAVDRAVSEGKTLDWFRKEFRSIVERNGWHGWKGEGTAKGEAWRTRVIYRTNIATSYAAGERAQLLQLDYKFWVYKHGNALEPRLQHLAWDGIALPPDHPFWATHSPPNGWGCTCRIRGANTEAGIRRAGGDPSKELPPGWAAISPKTGAPVGIDKGWAYAPGATVSDDIAALASKAVNWDYSVAVAYMRDAPAAVRDSLSAAYRRSPTLADDLESYARRLVSGEQDANPGRSSLPPQKTLGLVTADQLNQFASVTGQPSPEGLFDYVLDQPAVRHVFKRHGNDAIEVTRGQRAVTPADFGKLGQVLNNPDQVTAGDPDHRAGPTFMVSKTFGSERVVCLFEIRIGRRRIALVSMWIEKIVDASPTITP